jgi:hypothetical protein
MRDPIVEEVRNARQAHAKKFNHNLAAICKDLKRIESECGLSVISLPPRLLNRRSGASGLRFATQNRLQENSASGSVQEGNG